MESDGTIRCVPPSNWPGAGWGAPASSPTPAGPGERIYDAEGEYDFTWPYGVGAIRVEMYGPGAAGGFGGPNATTPSKGVGGGGGGSGAYAIATIGAGLFTSGADIEVYVGEAGTGGTKDAHSGSAQKYTQIICDGKYLQAYGGAPGFGGVLGGSGGAVNTNLDPLIDYVHVNGAAGTAGTNSGTTPVPGAGATGAGPGGGAGGKAGTTGSGGDGEQYAAGGGGANPLDEDAVGGAGPAGWVRISWPPE